MAASGDDRECREGWIPAIAVHKRLDDTNSRLGRLETKLDTIQQMLASYALDVARIKEKLGIA